jgi:hypothetical protein
VGRQLLKHRKTLPQRKKPRPLQGEAPFTCMLEPLLEELQDHLAVLVCHRESLHAELLLGLQSLVAG